MAIDNGFRTVWENNFDGFSITAANVIRGKFPVVALLNSEVLSRDRRHLTTLKIYNDNGTEKTHFDIDAKVTGISSKKKTAAIIAESEVLFINEDGQIMDRYTAKSDVKGVYLASDDIAYVVTADTISRVKVKVTQKFLGIF
jgi:thioredoxin reductase